MEPCVLVASACESLPSDVIIKGILGREVLPAPVNFIDGVRSFPWHINTKYYNADVHVCALDKKTIGCQAFADTVNAVVICFDSTSESKLETVEQWFTFMKEFEAQIKILVCDHCQEQAPVNSTGNKVGISKLEAQSWCIRNGFELVELNPEESDADSDVDDDFPESVGMPRVIQALHAHLWPNLTLKGAAERQILPPHAGLQDIANGFTPVGDISSSDTRAVDSDKGCKAEEKKKKEKEIKVATVKPMPKSEPTSTESSSSLSNSAENNNSSSQPRSQKEAPREEQLPSLATSAKVTHPATPSSSVTSSTAAHSQASAAPISSSTSSSCSTREIGIVPPLEIPDDSSQEDANQAEASSKSQRPASHPPAPHRDDRIDSMLEALDSMSEDNFEQLFQNLSMMKTKAANLSPTERKAYAEKMAAAFWTSIGGDEAEIGDLSSDGDED